MKTFIISILLAAVMLTGFGIYIFYLNRTTDELNLTVKNISELAKNEEWEECSEETEKLVKIWNKHEKILCSFTDHGDLDEVKKTVNELKESVFFEDGHHTVMSSSVLLVLIDRLTENEMPNLENILCVQAPTYILSHNML